MRLAGGTATSGRVEICIGGVWGRVCGIYWDIHDAQVICRRLGLPSTCKWNFMCLHLVLYFFNYVVPKAIFSSPAYGRGEGPILLSHLLCNGDEDSLNNCPHRAFGEYTCSDSNIAGVVCSNGMFIVCMCKKSNHFNYSLTMGDT